MSIIYLKFGKYILIYGCKSGSSENMLRNATFGNNPCLYHFCKRHSKCGGIWCFYFFIRGLFII